MELFEQQVWTGMDRTWWACGWPPWSHNLTPLGIFFWGQTKSLVYDRSLNDVMDLVPRIEVVAATIQDIFIKSIIKQENIFTCISQVTINAIQFIHFIFIHLFNS